MKTVESEMKNLFASGSVYTRRCPLASVVCLEFPFLNRLSPVGVPKTTAGKILFFFCKNPEAPSNLIRLERLTMTHKIPPTHTQSQKSEREPICDCPERPPA